MSGSSAKLCADYLPGALRARGPLLRAVPRGTRQPSVREYRRGIHGPTNSRYRPSAAAHGVRVCDHAKVRSSQNQYARRFATAVEGKSVEEDAAAGLQGGPLAEYDVRVQQGRLRDDPYQRRTLPLPTAVYGREVWPI